jgi:hypothetical protein
MDGNWTVWERARANKTPIKGVFLVQHYDRDDQSHDAIYIHFEDGSCQTIRDAGQSCCEYRYTATDCDLSLAVGATPLSVEVRNYQEGPEGEYGDLHETQFLNIKTSKGVLDFVTHNEHNGYYGGFYIVGSCE